MDLLQRIVVGATGALVLLGALALVAGEFIRLWRPGFTWAWWMGHLSAGVQLAHARRRFHRKAAHLGIPLATAHQVEAEITRHAEDHFRRDRGLPVLPHGFTRRPGCHLCARIVCDHCGDPDGRRCELHG